MLVLGYRRISASVTKYLPRHSALFSQRTIESTLCRPIQISVGNTESAKLEMAKIQDDKLIEATSNEVYVSHQEGSDSMTISFKINRRGKTRSFNLNRCVDDSLEKVFERIKLNLAKVEKKKGSKRTDDDVSGDMVQTELLLNGNIVDPTQTKCIDAWIEGAKFRLDDQIFTVGKNRPFIMKMRLPCPIMKGYTIIPQVKFDNCDAASSKFEWFRLISSKEKAKMVADGDPLVEQISTDFNLIWLKVGDSFSYEPSEDDVCHLLKCVCEPIDDTGKIGPKFASTSSDLVELGPIESPFRRRHELTSKQFAPEDSKFRFVSYNILADLYADQEYSRSVLFAHCPPFALNIDYRRQLLFNEIRNYNADIICLQEVDKSGYQSCYEPFFRLVTGHLSVFHPKGGQVAEGEATFFRRDRFELVESHRTILNKLIDPEAESSCDIKNEVSMKEKSDSSRFEGDSTGKQEYAHPILDQLNSVEAQELLSKFDVIRSKLLENKQLFARVVQRHTILQTSLLRVLNHEDRFLLVANTHLYFAPDADHIRLLQGCIIVRYLEYIKGYYTRLVQLKGCSRSQAQIDIIFCGDMNSSPDCGLYTLLQQGQIESTLKDWSSNPEEAVKDLSFGTHLRFSSAYKNIAYTNYTPAFSGCLDYIYYETAELNLHRTIAMPSHEDVLASDGLPSDVFPSDHIALVAELELRQRGVG